MSIGSVAAVPAAARLWPSCGGGGDPGVGELLDAARDALAVPDDVRTRVLLVAGPSGVVHDRAVVAAGDEVGTARDVELPVDGDLMAAVAGRTGFSRGRTDRLGGDLAELVRGCAVAAPGAALLPIELPEHAGRSTLEAVAAGLRSAAEAASRAVGVVAAGELAVSEPSDEGGHAAGSDAARFDERILAALHTRDVEALAALGPRMAGAVGARGWGPLLVVTLLAEMAGLDMGEPRYHACHGRGRVVVGA